MRTHMKAVLLLSVMPVFYAATVQADPGVDVKITNDGTEVIMVTVYDISSNPSRLVLANQRINGFSSVPVSVIADASGRAKLKWTAIGTDPTFPRCGHSHASAGNDDSVNVHADSACTI
jgi:hypothetical protein